MLECASHIDELVEAYVLSGTLVFPTIVIAMVAWKFVRPQPRRWLRRYALAAATVAIPNALVVRRCMHPTFAAEALLFVAYCLVLEMALSPRPEPIPRAIARVIRSDPPVRRSRSA